MDMIIGVIAVVVWIVSQVLSRKKDGTGSPSAPGEPAPPSDPQEELRRFFEQIEKSTHPPVEVKPAEPPPLPPALPRVQAQLKRQHATHHVPHPAPLPAPPLPGAAPVLPLSAIPEPSSLPLTVPQQGSAPVSVYSPALLQLHDPIALRRMIVTMEVLGKPVALRQTA